MTAIPVYLGHPRDPHKEPRFGDVFRWSPIADLHVMFLFGNSHDWTGLNLVNGEVAGDYQDTTYDGWEFVETITLHAYATGGVLPATDFSGMLVRAAMARLGAELS